MHAGTIKRLFACKLQLSVAMKQGLVSIVIPISIHVHEVPLASALHTSQTKLVCHVLEQHSSEMQPSVQASCDDDHG